MDLTGAGCLPKSSGRGIIALQSLHYNHCIRIIKHTQQPTTPSVILSEYYPQEYPHWNPVTGYYAYPVSACVAASQRAARREESEELNSIIRRKSTRKRERFLFAALLLSDSSIPLIDSYKFIQTTYRRELIELISNFNRSQRLEASRSI